MNNTTKENSEYKLLEHDIEELGEVTKQSEPN